METVTQSINPVSNSYSPEDDPMSQPDDDSEIKHPARFLGIGLGDWLTFCCTVAGGIVLAGAAFAWAFSRGANESPVVPSWAGDGTLVGAVIGGIVAVGVCIADVVLRHRK